VKIPPCFERDVCFNSGVVIEGGIAYDDDIWDEW
jgi:hypothetical protein